MKLSVCILTWNTIETLKQTLYILKQELFDIDHEIIIVDNGSTDGCQDLATIKNGTNLGISRGKNQGIDASIGDYIMLIDGDVVPVQNSIVMLLGYMEAEPECEAIGFLPNKGTDCKEHCEAYCGSLTDLKTQEFPCLYYGMYRRSVFDKGIRCDDSGEFAGVGYGYEDRDFYNQMKSKGIKQWVVGINKQAGRYYHELNSSIRQMGREVYIDTSLKRHKRYKKKWYAFSEDNT